MLIGDDAIGPSVGAMMKQIATANEDLADDPVFAVCLALGFVYESRQMLRNNLYTIDIARAQELFSFWAELQTSFDRAAMCHSVRYPCRNWLEPKALCSTGCDGATVLTGYNNSAIDTWHQDIEPMHAFARSQCGDYIDLSAIESEPATDLMPEPTIDQIGASRQAICPDLERLLAARLQFRTIVADVQGSPPIEGEAKEAYQRLSQAFDSALTAMLAPEFYATTEPDVFGLRKLLNFWSIEVEIRQAAFGPGHIPMIDTGYTAGRHEEQVAKSVQQRTLTCDLPVSGPQPGVPPQLSVEILEYENGEDFSLYFCTALRGQFAARAMGASCLAQWTRRTTCRSATRSGKHVVRSPCMPVGP